MPELQFRKMTKADLPVVTKIEKDCQSHPWTLLQFLDGFNAGHEGWVACKRFQDRELIIGFAIVATVLDERTLLNLCVRPAYQKQGNGKNLMTFLLAQAKAEKIAQFILEVRISKRFARNLYKALGFEKITVRKGYYPALDGREDGLVYSLSFSSASSSSP